MNILVVEDSSAVRALFNELVELNSLNVKLFSAKNYNEYKKVIDNYEIDKVFVDILLDDGESGFDIAKDAYDKGKEVYIVSGFDEEYIKKRLNGFIFIKKDENLLKNLEKILKEQEIDKEQEKTENINIADNESDNKLEDNSISEENVSEENVEEFIEDDDFFDFDSDLDGETAKKMDELNKSHCKVDAKTFLETIGDKEKLKSDAEEVLEKIVELEVLNEDNYELYNDLVVQVFDEFELLINESVLLELQEGVDEFINFIENFDYHSLNEKQKSRFIKYLQALLFDIEDWIKHVYIDEDAVDVCYLNASILNSILILREISNG